MIILSQLLILLCHQKQQVIDKTPGVVFYAIKTSKLLMKYLGLFFYFCNAYHISLSPPILLGAHWVITQTHVHILCCPWPMRKLPNVNWNSSFYPIMELQFLTFLSFNVMKYSCSVLEICNIWYLYLLFACII